MSEIGDIITDYRQHTRWVGTKPEERVARVVPAEVLRAIEAYEHARERRREANTNYFAFRDLSDLERCAQYGRLMEQWWSHLEALLPREPGWYPHAGHIYGFAKRGKCGFELTRDPASSRWPDPDRARAWALAWSRRRGEEERVREFCTAHKGAIR
jgi:hypothetical protein